eukprot:7381866-Prymnesium_polylepis.2
MLTRSATSTRACSFFLFDEQNPALPPPGEQADRTAARKCKDRDSTPGGGTVRASLRHISSGSHQKAAVV